MAARDVKEYYFKLIAQKAELEADLADFEEALKNGFITEEQMQAAKDELIPYQINLDRLTYIMYLLELPNRKAKKAKFANQNKKDDYIVFLLRSSLTSFLNASRALLFSDITDCSSAFLFSSSLRTFLF